MDGTTMCDGKVKSEDIGVATQPLTEANVIPLSNLIEILSPLSENLYIITGNSGKILKAYKDINIYLVNQQRVTNTFIIILIFIYTQFRISYRLMRITKCVDVWFFFLGEGGLLNSPKGRIMGVYDSLRQVAKDGTASV